MTRPITSVDVEAARELHVGCAFSLHELIVIIRGVAELDGGKRWTQPDGQMIRAEVLRAVTPLLEKADGHGDHEHVLGILVGAACSDVPPDERPADVEPRILGGQPLPRRTRRRRRR
jgi:hypothetical protein